MNTAAPSHADVPRRPHTRIQQRAAVLTLLDELPRAQADMVDETGLSQSALTRVVRDLRDDGLIENYGKAESTGGRRATVLRLRPDSRTAAGVRLRGNAVEVSIINLRGDEIHRAVTPWRGASLSLRTTLDAIRAARRAIPEASPLVGIRVAVPGVVNPDDATVSMAPDLGWREPVALQQPLSDAFHVPVTVDNDVNVMCAGEYATGALVGSVAGAMVFVGHRGIGAAVMAGGMAHAGYRGAAAEVGQVPIGPGKQTPSIEQSYCLPAIAGRLGISGRSVKRAAAIMFRKVADGDTDATALAQEVLEGWAYAITVVALIADPDRIALAGALCDLPNEALSTLRELVAERVPRSLELVRADRGEDGILSGAAGAALRDGLSRGLTAAPVAKDPEGFDRERVMT